MKISTFNFLKKLQKNNNREWFTENKNLYMEAQTDVLHFVENLIDEIGEFDEKIRKIDAKKSLFRIYRDTRFSKDKTPYKTNFGSSLGMGKGNSTAGYYLHVEPGKSFLAGGVWHPDRTHLKKMRKEISENSEEFLKIIENLDFKNCFKSFDQQEKLVKVPQGFEKDDPMADFLKLKNFAVIYPLQDEDFFNENAAAKFAEIYRTMKPLNDFLNLATA